MIKIINALFRNKCSLRDKCWEYDCAEWCSNYKPRLFGFIPVSREFGAKLEDIQEKLFFKFCVKEEESDVIDWFEGDDFDDVVSDN